MKIGFIGAGTVTRTLGRHLMTAGHTLVVSNSRGPETLAGFVADLGPGAIAGTKQQAARTVIFTSGDDAEAKQLVIDLINSTRLVAIDLGSPAKSGAMHEVGAPLSGLDLHFVRRLR